LQGTDVGFNSLSAEPAFYYWFGGSAICDTRIWYKHLIGCLGEKQDMLFQEISLLQAINRPVSQARFWDSKEPPTGLKRSTFLPLKRTYIQTKVWFQD